MFDVVLQQYILNFLTYLLHNYIHVESRIMNLISYRVIWSGTLGLKPIFEHKLWIIAHYYRRTFEHNAMAVRQLNKGEHGAPEHLILYESMSLQPTSFLLWVYEVFEGWRSIFVFLGACFSHESLPLPWPRSKKNCTFPSQGLGSGNLKSLPSNSTSAKTKLPDKLSRTCPSSSQENDRRLRRPAARKVDGTNT